MRGVHLSHWGRTSPAQVPPEGASQSLLAAVLGLILETDGYTPGAPEQVIRNPEAAPLFFHFLRGAREAVQAWGLDAWFRLLSGSMANLSACQRFAVLWAYVHGLTKNCFSSPQEQHKKVFESRQ